MPMRTCKAPLSHEKESKDRLQCGWEQAAERLFMHAMGGRHCGGWRSTPPPACTRTATAIPCRMDRPHPVALMVSNMPALTSWVPSSTSAVSSSSCGAWRTDRVNRHAEVRTVHIHARFRASPDCSSKQPGPTHPHLEVVRIRWGGHAAEGAQRGVEGATRCQHSTRGLNLPVGVKRGSWCVNGFPT